MFKMKIIKILTTIEFVRGFNQIPPQLTKNFLNTASVGHDNSFAPFAYKPTSFKKDNLIVSFSNEADAINSEESDKKLEKKIEGRKKRVIGGYKITSISYLIIGLLMAVKSQIAYYSTGPVLCAGLAYILADAAKNNRLASDTYKRLNLTLGTSCLMSCIASIAFKGPTLGFLIPFIAFVNSVKGYGYGLKGWELKNASAKEDIKNGLKSSIATMTKTTNIKSIPYLAATLITGAMTIMKIVEIIQMVLNDSKGFTIGTRIFRLSKLILMTTTSFTLKDAADRDRLNGTTFIQLNYLLSFTFAALAGILQAANELIFCGVVSLLSVYSLFNGISYAMMKKNTK